MKNCLTIAGSDCSGGAGIQADLKTFSALGCYGMSAITSVVAENTGRVISSMSVSPSVIYDQLEAVFSDIRVDAVKIGMLPDAGAMHAVTAALSIFINTVIPMCTLLTPNIPEAEKLLGCTISDFTDIKAAALSLFAHGAGAVLIKGGHLDGEATDVLFDGKQFHIYSHERIAATTTHGTGCTLSSAIAAFQAQGEPLPEAVAKAKDYVTGAIEHGINIGKGHGPLGHFYRLLPESPGKEDK